MAKRSVEVAPPKATTPRKGPPRRTRVVIRKVGPLSVLRISLFFYFCLFLILFFSLMILWGFLEAQGFMDSIGDFLGKIGAVQGTTCTENAEGVQTCAVNIESGPVFTRMFFAGLGLVVVWSFINLLISFLYNLVADVIGGIELTLGEKR